MKTRIELIDFIKQNGRLEKGEYHFDNNISFRLKEDEGAEKIAVFAKVDTIDFNLWAHQDEVTQFYVGSASGLKGIVKMAAAYYKLARFLGVDIPQAKKEEEVIPAEVTKEINAMAEKIQEEKDGRLLNEGMVAAYEKVLAGVQITIQK